MQSPPNWPRATDALRPSPFPHPALHAFHGLAHELLSPAYWALDQLLGCCAPTASPISLGWLRRAASGVVALLLLVVVGLPLALTRLPLWLALQVWRRPFCYRPPPLCWAPPALWRPPAEPGRCFIFLMANLCLLLDRLSRFSNLPHSQRRAEAIGAALYRATDCSQLWPRAPRGTRVASLPVGLDVVCLQEVFDLRAARHLVNRLTPNLGPVLYDVGTLGLQTGPHLKLLDSGLLLASRYPLLCATFRCFPHARGEDTLASKGLLSTQVLAYPAQSTEGAGFGQEGEGSWGRPWCCRRSWAAWTGATSWDSCTARTCKHWLRTGPCAANS
ncbi:PREDICTED: sphingomyelin phosphodiesterase 3 isoform X1 [Cercocebus atys]|uniref:sphingomyelin phosphodiesterase 3 isoform X1 n=1 Tax=Cercocebus atys TaxID=9531 RepID=UPI0005F499CB|nr:PREDICTED: sphingomyelin phosphodiesterase 3 isoform X1 [Cercocebus atys]